MKCLDFVTLLCFPSTKGSYMYNQTDGAGWCFTSFCNQSCIVEKQARPCHTTTPPTFTTKPVITHCQNVNPPREVINVLSENSYFLFFLSFKAMNVIHFLGFHNQICFLIIKNAIKASLNISIFILTGW